MSEARGAGNSCERMVDGRWATRVSSYPKLRLAPERVRVLFERAGLVAWIEPGPRGMTRLVAQAPKTSSG